MIKFALFIVRLFKIPFEWLGVDFPQFEILLRTKLTIDLRSGPSAFQNSGRSKMTFGTQLFFFIVYGILLGFTAYSLNDLMLGLTIFFSVLMVVLAMTLISEFTTVLFDHRDNYILLPRPVNHSTLLILRLVHIQFYMGYIALALSLAAGVMIAIKYKVLVVLIYFLAVGLGTWLTLIFTTIIYLLISKTVEGEKFKDIVTYVQVIMGIMIFAGYQLIPRVMDSNILNNATMQVHWWTFLFPPAWLAALVRMSLFTGITAPVFILSFLAVVLPVTGAVFLIRFMSKGFEDILGEGSSENAEPVKQSVMTGVRFEKIKSLLCVSDMEKAGWNLAIATTRRDRKFKQSVYPYFGIMIVFAIVILKPDLKDLSVSLHKINEFSKVLFILIIGFAGSVAVTQLPYTDTPEASWIYRALPIKEHAHLLTGSVKALLVRFFLPLYLVVAILAIWFWGFHIFPQIVLGGLGIVLLILITLILQRLEIPFTQVREMQRKGMNSIIAIFNMLLVGVLSGLVYLTSFISGWVTILLCLPVAIIIVLVFRGIRRRKYKIA